MEAYRQNWREKIMDMMLLYHQIKLAERKNRRFRRFWMRPILQSRRSHGNWEHLIQELRLFDHETYFNFMRMTPQTFEEILSLVGSKLARQTTNCREPICAEARLSMTVRYLATGDSLKSMSLAFRVGISTTSQIIRETCIAIWDSMQQEFFTPSQENWLQVHNEFALRWNFPHCVGALDGKHVVITAPANSGSSFYNYKGQHSIVLMALVSSDYKFLMVDIGAQGRHSDGGIFKNSEIGRRFSEGLMDLPPPSLIDRAHTHPLPFVIVADEAFQLNSFTMRPYPGRNITPEKRIFNYRLSRARRVVENAFGIMAARWRIYHKPMNTSLATTEAIVQATICLHNFMMTRDHYCDANFADRTNRHGTEVTNVWRDNIPLTGAIQHYQAAGPNNQDEQLRSETNLLNIL
ncbi:Protein ALP1-like [Formica fusca]